MSDHTCDSEPVSGNFAGIILTVLEVLILCDSVAGNGVESYALSGEPGRGSDEDHAADLVGVAYRPIEALHAAHAAARDGKQFVDAEMLDELLLNVDHVADGDHRELEPVWFAGFWVGAAGAGST